MSDKDPKQIHSLDQASAGLRDFAALVGRYREQLVVEGFTREEAFKLCVAYQTEVFFGPDRS